MRNMRIRGKKCSVFGKFDLFCFLETPALGFDLLPYYRWTYLLSFCVTRHSYRAPGYDYLYNPVCLTVFCEKRRPCLITDKNESFAIFRCTCHLYGYTWDRCCPAAVLIPFYKMGMHYLYFPDLHFGKSFSWK